MSDRYHPLKLADAERQTPLITAQEIAECTTRLQAAVLNVVSEVDMAEIVRAQVAKAKQGDSTAAKTVFALVAAAAKLQDAEMQPKRKALPAPRNGHHKSAGGGSGLTRSDLQDGPRYLVVAVRGDDRCVLEQAPTRAKAQAIVDRLLAGGIEGYEKIVIEKAG